jgi:hypothetical protein
MSSWVSRFVAQETAPERLEAWVVATTRAILDQVPQIARVEGIAPGVEASVRGHWVAFLQQLDQPEVRFRMPAGGEQIALDMARARLPLETLVQFYRVAQQSVWAHITGVVRAIPDDDLHHADVLIYFWDRAGAWLDLSITESIDLYQSEKTRVLAGAAARRYETVQAVLDGALDDVRQISSALGGYPMSVHHTALALACDDHDDVEELELLALGLARAAGATQPLLVRPGGRQGWAWLATRDPLGPDVVTDAFRGEDRGTFRVAVGSPAAGVAGFVSSHREALATLAILAPDGTAQVQAYAEAELVVLLGCSAEVDRFVVRTLGDLVRDDEHAHRLRETVAAYLLHGGNVDEASRRLMVHRNTVRYRVGQAEQLLGRSITRLNAEIAVALRHLAAHHADGSLAGHARPPQAE